MQPLVQSAIDAANQGDNNKALELCKQALAANPNDVDAWLVVAAVVDQPERKRQCLNRVLALDPTNEIARDELRDMDRAAMGGTHTPPFISEPEPVSKPVYPPAPPTPRYSADTSAFEPEADPQTGYPSSFSSDAPIDTPAFESAPAPAPTPSVQSKAVPRQTAKKRTEKPLVFEYPLFWRIFMYASIVFLGCIGLLVAFQNVVTSLLFFGLALLMGLTVMVVSPKVEITEAGIRASSVFSSSEAKWNEIKSMKSSGMKQRLELIKSNGQVVKVSSQVSGYSRIVEILRQKRPDLFGMAASSPPQENMLASRGYEQAPSNNYGSPVSTAALSGTKKFEKSFIGRYGIYLFVIPLCLLAAWAVVMDPEQRIVASIAFIFLTGMMFIPLFEVNEIKVEPNRLTIETLFVKKVFSARQIREIKIQSVRGRYGTVRHFIVIASVDGKKYSLGGFSVGNEVMYGFLMNWWNAYRNK